MKQLKVIIWMGFFTTVLGAVLGALFGIGFGLIALGIDELLVETFLFGTLLGSFYGGLAGIVLGLFLGVVLAIALIGQDLPLDASQMRRLRLIGQVVAWLPVVAALIIVLLLQDPRNFISNALFLVILAIIAAITMTILVRIYSHRLTQVTSSENVDSKQANRGFFYYIVTILALIYAFIVIAPLLLTLVFGKTFLPLAFYYTFAHLLWLPAFGVIIVTLLMRRWGLSLLMLVPIAAFTFAFGARFIPQSDTQSEFDNPAWHLDVMTYNIQWRNGGYAETINVIEQSDADIVAFQELGFEAADVIEAELADNYPHMALHPQEWGINGQGIISRYPILESEFWQGDGIFGAQEAIIEFETEFDSVEVVIHNVHPYNPAIGGFFNPNARSIGIQNILNRVDDDTQDYRVLLGDFNMPDLSTDYDLVTEEWQDVYAQSGWGLGLTFRYQSSLSLGIPVPLLRLDYIFYDGFIRSRRAEVVQDTGGSDHHPVLSRLYLNLDPTASELR